MISGTSRSQPESARGTIKISRTTPAVTSANPIRMIALARRPPARLPASSAIANMLRDSGAIESPASIALYSNTICR